MYKFLATAWCFALLALIGCSNQQAKQSNKLPVFVSIPPQKYFVQRVGGDHVDVNTMVGPAQSPATYEPTPRQMMKLSRAKLYFRVGVPFEATFLPKLQANYPNLAIIDTRKGIQLRPMDVEDADHEGRDDHGHAAGLPDPHIWLDPNLVKIQAATICEALCRCDPANEQDYRQNLKAFQQDLTDVDQKIREALAPLKNREFFVFHPSFGYFADAYDLKQVPVEVGGKEPSARQLSALIEKAKRENVRVIFIQPQFSTRSAEAIARAINGAVVPIDPLAEDYIDNLYRMAREIHNALQEQNN